MAQRFRKNHYLPKFWLAGFTQSGDIDDDLHVLDLAHVNEWKSSPEQAANRRDFYAVDFGPNTDPSIVEQILSGVEGQCSQVIREIIKNKHLPASDGFDVFLNFIALMVVRTPRTRSLFSLVSDSVVKDHVRAIFATPKGWCEFRRVLEDRGMHTEDKDFERYEQFALGEDYSADLDQTSHVQMMVEMIDPLLPALAARHWSIGIAAEHAPDLICSDFPVSAWPTKDADMSKPLSLNSPHTLLSFPITRRLIALAAFEPQTPIVEVRERGIALFNTITVTGA
jgi:hypothetical protein